MLIFYNKRKPNRVYLPVEVILAPNQGRMSPPMRLLVTVVIISCFFYIILAANQGRVGPPMRDGLGEEEEEEKHNHRYLIRQPRYYIIF